MTPDESGELKHVSDSSFTSSDGTKSKSSRSRSDDIVHKRGRSSPDSSPESRYQRRARRSSPSSQVQSQVPRHEPIVFAHSRSQVHVATHNIPPRERVIVPVDIARQVYVKQHVAQLSEVTVTTIYRTIPQFAPFVPASIFLFFETLMNEHNYMINALTHDTWKLLGETPEGVGLRAVTDAPRDCPEQVNAAITSYISARSHPAPRQTILPQIDIVREISLQCANVRQYMDNANFSAISRLSQPQRFVLYNRLRHNAPMIAGAHNPPAVIATEIRRLLTGS